MKTMTCRLMLFVACILVCSSELAWADDETETINVESVLITLIEQVEVPAQEAGVLEAIGVREGDSVSEKGFLAQIQDAEAQILMRRAKIDIEIAGRKAKNDVNVRFTKKSLQVAQAELKRAIEAVEKYKKSVSATELDKLRLSAERAALEIEQSQEELQTSQLTLHSKENEFKLALHHVERRKIIAPISGIVVEINKRKGEWVEPGETVIRILHIDRLRAEGFLNAGEIVGDLTGHEVTVSVSIPGQPNAQFPGTLVFVSPEVNPVNGQVRIWAEIENRGRLLRPGLRGAMSISLKSTTTSKPTEEKTGTR